jgi:hypothetical protein
MGMIRSLLVSAILVAGCGGDDSADSLGVGAQCTANDECNTDLMETCLTQFKGGYCGLSPCAHDTDCPPDSACIHHTDNVNYCFRTCADKTECNANRDAVNEANCSSSVTFVDGTMNRKACVPPSG